MQSKSSRNVKYKDYFLDEDPVQRKSDEEEESASDQEGEDEEEEEDEDEGEEDMDGEDFEEYVYTVEVFSMKIFYLFWCFCKLA